MIFATLTLPLRKGSVSFMGNNPSLPFWQIFLFLTFRTLRTLRTFPTFMLCTSQKKLPLQRQFAKDNQKQYSYRNFMPNHLHICKKISTFAKFFQNLHFM